MTFVSQVIGHEHIAERESMDAARAQEKRTKAEREMQIASLRSRLDSAKRKLDEPHFSNDQARSLYRGMLDTVDALAQSYVRELHASTHSARKSEFRLDSQEAVAYFSRDAIAAKLPALAEAAMARDPQRPPAIPDGAVDQAMAVAHEEIDFCRAELLKLGANL